MGKEVGGLLQEARELARITQRELAESLGLGGPQQLSNIERGVAPLPDYLIAKIALVLNVDLYGLVETILHERCREILRNLKLPVSVASRLRAENAERRRRWLQGVNGPARSPRKRSKRA